MKAPATDEDWETVRRHNPQRSPVTLDAQASKMGESACATTNDIVQGIGRRFRIETHVSR